MKANYDKNPKIRIPDTPIFQGWNEIINELKIRIKNSPDTRIIVAVECYTGVFINEIETALKQLNPTLLINTEDYFKPEPEIQEMTFPDVTNDRIFGKMTSLKMQDFLDQNKLTSLPDPSKSPLTLILGPAATLILQTYTLSLSLSSSPKPKALSLILYAEPSRWEIQTRMKAKKVHGLGINDAPLDFSHQYKRGYFVDWRVCDQLKQEIYNEIDYFIDTNIENQPKMLRSHDLMKAMQIAASRPFRVVPYFDPGPWGGQWMKEVCDLDKSQDNYAWCFDCVPEENSLKFDVGGVEFETPAINLIFLESKALLGEAVEQRFGKEFPIRFDFLDTMGGGNLSFQVHPTSEYIREAFGMTYTQDESYYLLDAGDEGTVYLGIKDDAKPEEMFSDLRAAQAGGPDFPAEKYVNIWPAKKHDHFLIPAGTVHCSGKNSMVLEISSTPYIFTFKMWDWARLGLDGKPRPINIDHAEKVIQWNRRTEFTRNELVNHIEPIAEGDGWREEKTGLHELEFIETRRHWFTKPVHHKTEGSVNVLNLVE